MTILESTSINSYSVGNNMSEQFYYILSFENYKLKLCDSFTMDHIK